jgi:hypothetical protein
LATGLATGAWAGEKTSGEKATTEKQGCGGKSGDKGSECGSKHGCPGKEAKEKSPTDSAAQTSNEAKPAKSEKHACGGKHGCPGKE